MYNSPWFLQQFRDVNGSPLAGGNLYFYVAGSTTLPKNVYVDFAGTTLYTQPVILDGSGFAPEYFLEAGLYKIVVRSADGRLIATRDNVAGTGYGGESSGGSIVKVSGTDALAGYLSEKVLNTPSISWTISTAGGYQQLQATVNPAGILDGRILMDSTDPTMGYLADKIANSSLINLVVDPTTHKLRAEFTGPDYMPLAGGSFTGPVSAPSLTAETITLTDLSGAGDWIKIDGSGTLIRVASPETYTVKYNAGDLIPGYLGAKIVAGTGITINTTTDGVDGVVMHINSAAAGSVGKVKVDAADTVAGYLGTKIVSGVGIVLRETTGVDGTVLHIDLDIDSLYTANGKAKSEAVAVSGSGLFNFAHVDLQPGYYHLSAQMYVEATVSGATLELECNASDETYTFATDLYTGYAKASTGTAQRLAAVVTDNKIRLTTAGSIYLVGRLVGSYTAGTAWGHISATRIA